MFSFVVAFLTFHAKQEKKPLEMGQGLYYKAATLSFKNENEKRKKKLFFFCFFKIWRKQGCRGHVRLVEIKKSRSKEFDINCDDFVCCLICIMLQNNREAFFFCLE